MDSLEKERERESAPVLVQLGDPIVEIVGNRRRTNTRVV
jgi:hypothetical protein